MRARSRHTGPSGLEGFDLSKALPDEPMPPRSGSAPEPAPGAVHPEPLHTARPILPTHPEEALGFRNILRRRDFTLLWGAQAASQLADKFFMFTLLIEVYTLSGSDSLQSVLMIAYTLPSFFLSAPAGVYADRHDKRTLMLGTNLIRGGLILLVPLSQALPALQGHAWPLLVVTFLFSAVGQVFAPAEAASIPSLVSHDQIEGATSLFMTTVILTLVLGIPAAPLAVRFFGNEAPFYIAAGLFLIAALAIFGIGSTLRAVPKGTAPETHVFQELREGVAILGRSPVLRLGLYQLTLALVVVFTVFALGPSYLDRVLHRNPQDTYIVLIPATLGLIVTAAALGQRAVSISRARLMVVALLTGGACLVGIGIAPLILDQFHEGGLLLFVVIALAAVFGCALGGILIPAFTVLQERSTPETRGRIFGGIFTVINVAIAIPLLVAGVAADLFHSVGGVLAGLGVILIAVAIGARTIGWGRLAALDETTAAPLQAATPPHRD